MSILTKLSFTKLTFFMMITTLCFITIYVIMKGLDGDNYKAIITLYAFVMTSMVSFYFGQKSANITDSLVKEDTSLKQL